jgi:hypothetical protein
MEPVRAGAARGYRIVRCVGADVVSHDTRRPCTGARNTVARARRNW